ncbi:MAG: hypothetical protein AB4352_06905 [Hormoscilla sp.]
MSIRSGKLYPMPCKPFGDRPSIKPSPTVAICVCRATGIMFILGAFLKGLYDRVAIGCPHCP